MRKFPAAVVASVSAAVLAAGGASVAFAAPAAYPVQAPSSNPTATPDPHASMTGMDHDDEMAGMDHDEMAGPDHDEMADMDHEAPAQDQRAAGTGSPHSHSGTAVPDTPRPQGLVVGGFALLNGGVLLTAGLMRRRAKLSATKPSGTSGPAKLPPPPQPEGPNHANVRPDPA